MPKPSDSAQSNRANQLNPTHPAYYQSRGASLEEAQRMASLSKPALDNHANQLNPNNVVHAASRAKVKAFASSSNSSSAKPE